jgi:hypothetical protein
MAFKVSATRCGYCGRTAEAPIAVCIDDILELMTDGLAVEWSDAVQELPNETAEGGYQGTYQDTWDFFNEEVGFPTENEELQKDILGSFEGHLWCQRSYFSLTDSERLRFGWDDFCQIMKHQRRYFFLKPQPTKQLADEGSVDVLHIDDDTPTPGEILETFGEMVIELGLVKTVPLGHVYARARSCDPASRLRQRLNWGQFPLRRRHLQIE